MKKNDLTSELDEEIKTYKRRKEILENGEFQSYIEKKCLGILNNLTGNLLLENNKYAGEYMKSHKAKADNTKVVISNEALVDLKQILSEQYYKETQVKLTTNYANGFDLAKAVEYGTGLVGASSYASAFAKEDDWEYDVNNHGTQGWFYKRDGNIYWTNGYTGTLIYERAKNEIEENITNWIDEYVEKNS